MRSNYKKLGLYIREVNIRNNDLQVDLLLGVSIQKIFMPSIANTVGSDMSKYKIIKHHQFAYGPVTSRNGDKISVALLQDHKEAIISQAYIVFEVIDQNELDPEYLMMWFSRPEFDRYARFKSHGSARETFDWDEMCEVELPIPSIEKQREIVKEYNTVVNRIKLNEQLNQKLEETAQALYKHWFVDLEFPISKEYAESVGKPELEGKSYKSSGGEMEWCEELDKEVPKGWGAGSIGELFTLQRGHDLPTQDRINGEYPIFASTGIAEFHNEFKFDKPTIITGRSGSLGELYFYDKPCWPLNTTLYIKEFKKASPLYSLYFLQTINLKEMGSGSAVPTLNRNDIHALPCPFPETETISHFESMVYIIYSYMQDYKKQTDKLFELSKIILYKMTKVEVKEKEVVG